LDKGEYEDNIVIKQSVWIDSENGAVLKSKSGVTLTINFSGSARISRVDIISKNSNPAVLAKNGSLSLIKCKIGIFWLLLNLKNPIPLE
jgi:hypothetical protein